MPVLYLGVDVSKEFLDVCDGSTGRSWRIANTVDAIDDLAHSLTHDTHVIFEATGVYDQTLRNGLNDYGVPYSRINSRRARSFADAAGFLGKTDKVDAAMLAEYGRRFAPRTDTAIDPKRHRLQALLLRREQLVEMRKQEKTRLLQAGDQEIATGIRDMIAHLSRLIRAQEADIRTLINADDDLSQTDQRLRQVPGIGDIVAATLIAHLPELGRIDRRAIAALTGVAPIAADSGKHRGKRKIAGGRKSLRKALYMAAVTARKNNQFHTFFIRLINNGKPTKVALIATARKILTTVNAMIRDSADFKTITP